VKATEANSEAISITTIISRMDTKTIIQEIDSEIARLEQAKTLLNGSTPTPSKR
jgi:hypothetical protein